MAPKPETVGSIDPMAKEDACDACDTNSSTNQYTNKAFVKDDELENVPPSPANDSMRPSNDDSVVDKLDFDDILPHIGEFGTYQKILFFLMIPFAFFVAFVYFSQIFITLVPEKHWCRIYELEHLSTEQR